MTPEAPSPSDPARSPDPDDLDPARPSPGAARTWTVPPDEEGTRLDRFLVTHGPEVSRTRWKAAIRSGGVRVDGEIVTKPGGPLAPGQSVSVAPGALEVATRPSRGPGVLEVVYEDDDIVVIDKPPGMVAHPTGAVRGGTVSELAVERYGPLPTHQGPDRPGVIHRLDGSTSGLMVLARTDPAFKHVMNQFRQRTVDKTYLAIVYGDPRFDTGYVEAPIMRSVANPSRMDVAPEGQGREAVTYYEVRERFGDFALVACKPKTGRTHQIRVHMTSIGHPLLGDPVYKRRGGPSARLPASAPVLERQALHAARIAFQHPVTREAVRFEAPLPADFAEVLEWLRADKAGAGT